MSASPARRCTYSICWGPSKSGLMRSEEHTSELQSLTNFVCRLLLEKKLYTFFPSCVAPREEGRRRASEGGGMDNGQRANALAVFFFKVWGAPRKLIPSLTALSSI